MSRAQERAMKFAPAVLENVPLLIGLSGPPGGGKTRSGLMLATGIQQVRPGPIRVIDTEGGRSRKYSGEVPFEVLELDHPRGDVLQQALQLAIADNPACVMIDTLSDEHEELLAWKEEEVDRLLAQERNSERRDPENDRNRDRVAMSAWRKPKAARRDLRNAMQKVRVPLICCFRAEEKTRPIEKMVGEGENQRKVAVPTNMGWQPIAPTMFVHLMDVLCLLPLRAEGTPTWQTGNDYSDFPLKKGPPEIAQLFAKGERITPQQGTELALWAKGQDWGPEQEELLEQGRSVALEGKTALRDWWRKLKPEQKGWLARHRDSLGDAAAAVDEGRGIAK